MELRERVAKAWLRSEGSDIQDTDTVADYHLQAADAAIAAVLEAMREPSDAMVEAFEKTTGFDYSGSVRDGLAAAIGAFLQPTDGAKQ